MLEIVLYSFATTGLLYFFGFGLSKKFLPTQLQVYSVWFAPWMTIITVILSGILIGYTGATGEQWAPVIGLLLSILTVRELKHIKIKRFELPLTEKILLLFSIALVLLNLSPLFLQQKFPTTISLGSNDAQAFAVVPDFLLTHSVKDGFGPNVPGPVYTLLPFGYRIGQSIIAVFFMVLFNLRGYQLLTIVQTVLFSVAIPLVYVFYRILYKERSSAEALIAVIMVGLNVNLLYYLYHNFFGQILFLGLYLFLILVFLVSDRKPLSHIIAGAAFAALFYSYHEAAIFIVLPVVFLAYYQIFIKKRGLLQLLFYARTAFITALLAGPAIFHAVKFTLFYRTQDFNSPIGWQPFRTVGSSFVNPFEMLGIYSIHGYPEIPMIVSLILSLVVLACIGFGIMRTKNRIFILGLVGTYSFFIIFLALIHPNFWFYNRAVSYAVPILTVLFLGGVTSLLQKKKALLTLVLMGLVTSVIYNGISLNNRYLRENLAVEAWMLSLSEIKDMDISPQTIYSEHIFNPSLPIWKEIWAEYFLEPKLSFITSLEYKKQQGKLHDGDIVLISKNSKYIPPASVALRTIIWENQNYKLGEICISDDCLNSMNITLSNIDFTKPQYVDSLLLEGWGGPEKDHRWIASREASLRLKNTISSNQLVITGTTLKAPQKMSVFVDGKIIGSASLTTRWVPYKFSVNVSPGIHEIKLVFSNVYRPSDLFQTLDTRELAANIRVIELK